MIAPRRALDVGETGGGEGESRLRLLRRAELPEVKFEVVLGVFEVSCMDDGMGIGNQESGSHSLMVHTKIVK